MLLLGDIILKTALKNRLITGIIKQSTIAPKLVVPIAMVLSRLQFNDAYTRVINTIRMIIFDFICIAEIRR